MEIDQLCDFFEHLSVNEVTNVSCEEEDILCKLFDGLDISDAMLNITTLFISSPIGSSRTNAVGIVSRGSIIFSKVKGSGQPWMSTQFHYWTQRCSGNPLSWKRQLRRDYYLFFFYSGVRKKINWLLFGYLGVHKRWVEFYFYILWRYRSNAFASVILLESSAIKLGCLIIFSDDDSNRFLIFRVVSWGFHIPILFVVCVCDFVRIKASCRDLYLHWEFLRQFEDFEDIQILLKATREVNCVVIRGWYLRRVFCSQTRVIDGLNLVDVTVFQRVLKNILMSRVKSHRSRLMSWVMLHRSKLSYWHESWCVVTVNGPVTEILLPEMLLPEILLPMILVLRFKSFVFVLLVGVVT